MLRFIPTGSQSHYCMKAISGVYVKVQLFIVTSGADPVCAVDF
jgi:hypothetical protein